MTSAVSLKIRFARVAPAATTQIAAIESFYDGMRSEHLFPRTAAELRKIAEHGSMFAAECGGRIVAACYVKWDDPSLGVREFGGICIAPDHRTKKLASILANLSIATALTMDETRRMKANVHKENTAPDALLLGLGFILSNETATLPPEAVRSPMKPSEPDGSVTGRVYEFDFATGCRAIASWLSAWPMRVAGQLAQCDFGEDVGNPRPYLKDLATELGNIADERS